MWRETNLFGIYLPPLLVYVVTALGLHVLLRLLLVRLGFFTWTWNPPLAEMSIYLCILGLLVQLL